jgi:uncharacterized protein (DUF488 family)
VADVRSRPYSRFVPHFSKERLQRILADEGIGYLFLGQELGGKPPRAETYAATPDYASRIREPEFRSGIDALLAAARRERVIIVCRERDPLDCHRLHLICRYVKPLVDQIQHILPGGELEAQAVTEVRLLARAGRPELPLFVGEAERLEQAYDRWWQRAR